jgi:hypothetical protein
MFEGLAIGLAVALLVVVYYSRLTIRVSERCADRLLARSAGEFLAMRREEEHRTETANTTDRSRDVPPESESDAIPEMEMPTDLAERVQGAAVRYL